MNDTLMDDKAVMTGPMRLEIKRILNGPIDRVWEYLTDGELRKEWFCGGTTGSQPGEPIVFDFDHRRLSEQGPPDKYADSNVAQMSGQILVYERPHKLKFTWDEMHVEGVSTVTVLLKDLGERTELHLIHEDLVPRIQPGVRAGWHAHLDLLLDLLDSTPRRDFWVYFNALETHYEAESSAT
ncbi:MAG: SRPBCC domain-containing protein [Pseudomonadota bacterium]